MTRFERLSRTVSAPYPPPPPGLSHKHGAYVFTTASQFSFDSPCIMSSNRALATRLSARNIYQCTSLSTTHSTTPARFPQSSKIYDLDFTTLFVAHTEFLLHAPTLFDI
ncbi:hypothetical protein FRB94_003356 [Tulasnella sp. JGI-2019a]|nr:hypothetical protein FRB94_003356 [Tulasnella sp. JGI-2019a]